MQILRRHAVAWVAPLALIALVLAAYINSVDCAWQFDDHRSILDFHYAQTTLGDVIRFAPQRALTFVSFWLNYQLCGYNVRGWHMVNIGLHALNVLLVYALAMLVFRASARVTGGMRLRDVALPAAVVAAIFAVHPVQTQAVTYIVQRLELQAAFFIFAAILTAAYGTNARTYSGRTIWFGLTAAALALGAVSKEIIIAAPVIIVAQIVLLRAQTWRGRMLALGAGAVTGMVCLVGMLMLAGALRFTPKPYFSLAPFAVLWRETPPAVHYATQARALLLYVRLCLIPWQQRVEYDFSASAGFADPAVIGAVALQIAIMCVGVLAWRRKPAMLFGMIWFYAVMAPSVLMPNAVFEHRVYAALPGVWMAIVVPIYQEVLLQPASRRRALLAIVSAAFALLIISFLTLTIARNAVWRTPLNLWRDAAAKSPGSWRVNTNYGRELLNSADWRDAGPYLQRALAQNPSNHLVVLNLAAWEFNAENYTQCEALVRYALRLRPRHPLALEYLGTLFLATDRLDAGTNALLQAGTPDALATLARFYVDRGEATNALVLYERALKGRPGDARALLGMAEAFEMLQRTNDAARIYQELSTMRSRP